MPYIVRDLPIVTFSSGATASPALGGLDDASSLTLLVGNTTSTGGISTYKVQVELSDTGTNWRDLSTTVQNASTAVSVTVSNISFRQIRLASTAADNSGLSVFAAKQISV